MHSGARGARRRPGPGAFARAIGVAERTGLLQTNLADVRRTMDTLSPLQRSARMSRIRLRDTKPELAVRRLVYGLGYRYRLHRPELPGKPDMVFVGRCAVIFIHGCFWHRHPDPSCKLARMPKSRLEFWEPKLTSNRERDLAAEQMLNESGWRVLTVWECELRHREAVAAKVRDFLR